MATHAKPHTPQLTTGGWIRIALYVLTVIVALVATLAPIIGFGEYTDVAQALAAILAVLSGGTATLNVPKADDQNVNLRELGPTVLDLVREVQGLRQQAATPEDVANELEARQLAPKPDHAGGTDLTAARPGADLPVYQRPSAD